MGADCGVGDAEAGLVAGGFVAYVSFGDVVAEESDEMLVERDVGCDGVVVAGHSELCCVGYVIPAEDAFTFENFEMA